MSRRLAIMAARQVLLLRAMRGEFKEAPAGEFEARWDALDPSTPAPKWRSVAQEEDAANPLDGARLWDKS